MHYLKEEQRSEYLTEQKNCLFSVLNDFKKMKKDGPVGPDSSQCSC